MELSLRHCHLGCAMMRRCAVLLILSTLHLPCLLGASTLVQDFEVAGEGTPYRLVQQLNDPPPHTETGDEGTFLRLTSARGAKDQFNCLVFEHVTEGGHATIVADLDFRITAPAFRNRSDGFSFLLLNTDVYGDQDAPPPFYSEEPDLPGSLGIAFDVYRNTGCWLDRRLHDPISCFDDPDRNHVSVHFDGRRLGVFPLDSEVLDLADGQVHHVRIQVDARENGALVSVSVSGRGGADIEVISAFEIPDLLPYESRVAFSGRLGNAGADQDLDNIEVAFLDPVPVAYVWVPPDDLDQLVGVRADLPDTLRVGDMVEVPIWLDLSSLEAALGAYEALIAWDEDQLELQSLTAGSFSDTLYPHEAYSQRFGANEALRGFGGLNPLGQGGLVHTATAVFQVLGPPGAAGQVAVVFPWLIASEAWDYGDLGRMVFAPAEEYHVWRSNGSTAVVGEAAAVAAEHALMPPYPNPFNAGTVVRYSLPHPGQVELSVYDISGQHVRDLVRQRRHAGGHQATWDGRDQSGEPVASGIYLLRLVVDGLTMTRKASLVR